VILVEVAVTDIHSHADDCVVGMQETWVKFYRNI